MMSKKGFTLVELAIVIAVITILLSVMITSYSAMKREAIVNNVVGFVGDFQKALYRFQSIYGRLPQSLDDNQFVPNFVLEFRREAFVRKYGFRPHSYSHNNPYCGNKPTISIEVYDGDILQELRRKLAVCEPVSTNTSIVVELVP